MRFVEVELPAAVAPRLVIKIESGLRLLLADPMDIGLAADFIARLRVHREGRPQVIGLGMSALKVYLAMKPCEMRKDFNSLTIAGGNSWAR